MTIEEARALGQTCESCKNLLGGNPLCNGATEPYHCAKGVTDGTRHNGVSLTYWCDKWEAKDD